MDAHLMNPLTLAYLGDAVYELVVREYLIEHCKKKTQQIHLEAIQYVSAKNQARFVKKAIENAFFTDEELRVFKRGRNCKTKHIPRNVDPLTYQNATGFETLIGTLYLEQKKDRILEVFNYFNQMANETNLEFKGLIV